METDNKNLTYQQAYNQLQDIISQMESNELQPDELSDKIKQASLLICICKEKLKTIEVDVNQLIADIEKQNMK